MEILAAYTITWTLRILVVFIIIAAFFITRLLLKKIYSKQKATFLAVLIIFVAINIHYIYFGSLLYVNKIFSGDYFGNTIVTPISVYIDDPELGFRDKILVYKYLNGIHLSRLAIKNKDDSITIYTMDSKTLVPHRKWFNELRKTNFYGPDYEKLKNKKKYGNTPNIFDSAININDISELEDINYHISIQPMQVNKFGKSYFSDQLTIKNLNTGKIHTISTRYWSCSPWLHRLFGASSFGVKISSGPYDILEQIFFNYPAAMGIPTHISFRDLNYRYHCDK